MKHYFDLIATGLIIAAALLLATTPASADERDNASGLAANQTVESAADAEPTVDSASTANSEADSETTSDSDADSPKTPPTAKELNDGLMATSPPGGVQLPAAPETDQSDWLQVDVGFASMLVPPGWTIQNQIGEKGAEDQTVGLSPPSNDIYVELRQIQNSDSNYEQTPLDLAQSDYRSSPDRLKEGVIFGFQPMVIDRAVGSVEIMNQFGKEKNEDGTPTFRMISWRGRWEQNDAIQKVEFTATFGQDQYEKVAPLVSSILATIKTGVGEPKK